MEGPNLVNIFMFKSQNMWIYVFEAQIDGFWWHLVEIGFRGVPRADFDVPDPNPGSIWADSDQIKAKIDQTKNILIQKIL